MKKVISLFLMAIVAIIGIIFITPQESQAVPSFARQVQMSCNLCHTVWPNLNKFGRQMKVRAYTDVSPDWNRVTMDKLDLLTVLPVSVRALTFPYIRESNHTTKTESVIPDEMALFFAGRAGSNVGFFVEVVSEEWEAVELEMGKFAFQFPFGQGNTFGLVAMKADVTGADPFNSLGGRHRALTYGGEAMALPLMAGWSFMPMSMSNQGVVAHAYLLGNRLYAAAGAMRGGEPMMPDMVGTGEAHSDPIDIYYRLAWDQQLPVGALTLGGALYSGKQELSLGGTEYDSKVQRTFLDASLEAAFDDHLVEVQALYGTGKDKGLKMLMMGKAMKLGEGKFNSFHVEGSYFFQRRYGAYVAYNTVDYKNVAGMDDADKQNATTVGITYLPWLNTKVGIQYTTSKVTKTDGDSEKEKITRVVLDLYF